MNHIIFKYFALGLMSILLLDASPVPAQEKGKPMGWTHLKYSLYFTSHDIDSLLANQDQFTKTMEFFAPVKPVHVYLGTLHGVDKLRAHYLGIVADLGSKHAHEGGKDTGGLLRIGSAYHDKLLGNVKLPE